MMAITGRNTSFHY